MWARLSMSQLAALDWETLTLLQTASVTCYTQTDKYFAVPELEQHSAVCFESVLSLGFWMFEVLTSRQYPQSFYSVLNCFIKVMQTHSGNRQKFVYNLFFMDLHIFISHVQAGKWSMVKWFLKTCCHPKLHQHFQNTTDLTLTNYCDLFRHQCIAKITNLINLFKKLSRSESKNGITIPK